MALLNVYLYYAEYTEKLIEHRNANNRYFLTVNPGVIAIFSVAARISLSAAVFG